MNAATTFPTAHANRYLAILCEHFAPHISVVRDGTSGRFSFGFGDCSIAADEHGLSFTVTAPDTPNLLRVKEIITRHFERFAFRENPHLEWTLLPQSPQSKET